MEKLFPVLIMVQMAIAGIIYFISGKPGPGIYWVAGSILNFAVIFLIKN